MSDQSVQSERRVTRQVGSEELVLIWPPSARTSRFASIRLRRGIRFVGVQATLDKPHGLKPVMQEVLRLVTLRGMKRYESILGQVKRKHGAGPQIADALELLVGAGVIAVRDRNQRPARGEYWQCVEITADERAFAELVGLYPARIAPADRHETLATEIEQVVRTWTSTHAAAADRIEALVHASIRRLRQPDGNSDFPLQPRALVEYRSVILALAHGRLHLGRGDAIPLRTLSARLWHNSKVLDRYRDRIARVAGIPLDQMGLTVHPDTVWLHGDACYELPGHGSIHLTAGRPPILAEATVQAARFRPNPSLRAVLLVENLTAFMACLHRTYLGRPDVLVMWSAGYWSHLHRHILRDILAERAVPVYVWCDMDGDGLLIASQICRWAERKGAPANPILMGPAEFERVAGAREATDRDLRLTHHPEVAARFSMVAELIRQRRVTVEQESLLDGYGDLEAYLP